MDYREFSKTRFAQGLTQEQSEFFRLFLESKRNLLVTGGAGVGKSFVIKRLSEFCLHENILLSKTASTGIAAINIGAVTLHSFMGLGLGNDPLDVLCKKVCGNKRALERVRHTKILLIDEASMLSGEILDKVHGLFQKLTGKQPRYIFVADFLQLLPVMREDQLLLFEGEAWGKIDPTPVVLSEIVRQDKESDYAKFLCKVRVGDKSDLGLLRDRTITAEEIPDGAMVAFCKNVDVDTYNETRLKELKTASKIYHADDIGQEPFLSTLKKNCLCPEVLELKVGAQVMLLKNVPDSDLVNGSIGKVQSFDGDTVVVDFNGIKWPVKKEEWKIEESYLLPTGKIKTRLLASRLQIPLKLAWANTIHKCQGITCDKIVVDLANAFAEGQTYVALSRARTIDGLWVLNFSPNAIKVNSKCLEFHESLEL